MIPARLIPLGLLLAALTACNAPTPTPAAGDEAAFLAAVRALPTLNPANSDALMVTIGQEQCTAIGQPGVTRTALMNQLARSALGADGPPVLSAAERHLCPDRRYSTDPAPASAPDRPASPAVPSGPQTTFGDGTYRVGSDIEPGTYRAPGTEQSCYWARLKDLSGTLDAIVASDLAQGPATVSISTSDVAFKTARCGTWTKVG